MMNYFYFTKALYHRILRLERERGRCSDIYHIHASGYSKQLALFRFNEICRDMEIFLVNNRKLYQATRSAVREIFRRRRGKTPDLYESGLWYLKHTKNDALIQKCRQQFCKLDDIPF